MFTPEQLEWFRAFEDVRESGLINMFNTKAGCDISGLTKDQWDFVRNNYGPLEKQAEEQDDDQ